MSNTLWLAYADLIKSQLQVTQMGPNDVIMPYPVTQRGPAAGKAIPSPVTNFLVFNTADNLRPADSPDSKTAGSYTKELRQYLYWVEPGPPASPGALQCLADANKILDLAEKNLQAADDEAFDRYEKAKKRNSDIAKYEDWVVENAPKFMQQKQTTQNAAQSVRIARTDCYGPDGTSINQYLSALETAISGTTKSDNYNMPSLTTDKDMRAKFEEAGASGGSVSSEALDAAEKASTRVPIYQINTLTSTMNDWINSGSGKRGQWLKIDLNIGKSKTWKDYGFTSSSVPASWSPFFSVVVERDHTKKEETLNIENQEDNIELEISFQQIAALDIQRGLWDVPNVMGMFPKLREGAPSLLKDKVIVNKVLYAYDVALRATFKGSLREQARVKLEETKKAKGGLCIFGFHVGLGGASEEHVKTELDNVKWDEASGSILLAPSPNVAYPTLLGFLGQRL